MSVYTIAGAGFSATRSARPAAIALADATAKELKVELTVTTAKGAVVHTAKVRKTQVRTPRNTRIDPHTIELGEGVKLPKGWDVAYVRARTGLALLRKLVEGEPTYLVFDIASGKQATAESTRDASNIMKGVRKGELELVA